MAGTGGKIAVAAAVGIAFGALSATALQRESEPVVRSGQRASRLKARIATLERANEDLTARLLASSEGNGAAPGAGEGSRAPPGGDDAGAAAAASQAGAAAGELFRLASRRTNAELLERIGEDYAQGMKESAAWRELIKRLQERYLFRTRRSILAEFGRPSKVSRDERGATYHYWFDPRGGTGTHTFVIGFSSGVVTQVSFD